MSGNLHTRIRLGVNWQEAHILLESLDSRKVFLQRIPSHGISEHPDIATIDLMLSKLRKIMKKKIAEQQ